MMSVALRGPAAVGEKTAAKAAVWAGANSTPLGVAAASEKSLPWMLMAGKIIPCRV
jgi:hypothetical protein